MEILGILEEENSIRDFLGPIKEIPEFSSLEINSYDPTNLNTLEGSSCLGVVVEFSKIFLNEVNKLGKTPILIAYFPSKTDLETLEEYLKTNKQIYGLLDLEKSLGLSLPLLREFLAVNKVFKKVEGIREISDKVEKLRGDSLSQLTILKETFEKLIPIRSSKNNGLNIYVKFSSGRSQGGEFFDFINGPMETLILWNLSNTYGTSNDFLEHFGNWEEKTFPLEVINNFIKGLKIGEGQEIFLGQIDLKTLKFAGFNISDCYFHFYGDKGINRTSFEDPAPFSVQLERGERFFIFSTGAMENFKKLNPSFDLKAKINELTYLSSREAIDELYFELKRGLKEKFLPKDAAIILVEVDKNVIFQV